MFKHHYFVTVSVAETLFSASKKYMFIYCRAKDVQKTIMDKFEEGTKVGIDTITKLTNLAQTRKTQNNSNAYLEVRCP